MTAAGLRLPILACLVSVPLAAAPAQTGESVHDFTDRLIQASTPLFSSAAASEEEARRRCRRLVSWAFDVSGMARYALGGGWERAGTAERNAFRTAFDDSIVDACLRHLATRRGATMIFVGARQQSDGRELAATRLIAPDKPEQILIWQLRPSGHSWRVTDLIVDGRSVLYSERQEYTRILEATQGDISAVIEFIRNRMAKTKL